MTGKLCRQNGSPQTYQQWALGVRRYLGAVFWHLMYRYGRGVAGACPPLIGLWGSVSFYGQSFPIILIVLNTGRRNCDTVMKEEVLLEVKNDHVIFENGDKMPISEVMARAFNMEERFRTLMAYYRCAIMEVETKMRVLNETLSLQYDRNPIETIKSRLKNPKSIIEKMIRKGIAPTIENIEQNLNDIAGIRVICSFPEDVYLIARYLLQQDDVTLIEEKDYIKNPKPNGYRSLHLIIETPIFLADEKRMMRVEIQLRTIAMDFWASLEHKLHYKKNLACTEEIAEDLRICAEHSAQLDEEMQKIRTRIENAR